MQIDPTVIKDQHAVLVTRLETKAYYENFGKFRGSLQKQGKYMSTVMRMIETLFLFIRSTRQELWELQLVSLDRYILSTSFLWISPIMPE